VKGLRLEKTQCPAPDGAGGYNVQTEVTQGYYKSPARDPFGKATKGS
jgi:hypothetical protein